MDQLFEELGLSAFRVKYTCVSTVDVEANSQDLAEFLAQKPEAKALSYDNLRTAFVAWCIEEDGYDYDERSALTINEIQTP